MRVLKTQRSTWSGVAYWFTVMMFQPVMPSPGTLHPGGTQLLVDHDLLDGTRLAAPGLGPVRHHEPRLHQCLALLGARAASPIRSASARTSARMASASGGQVQRDLAGRPPGRLRRHVLGVVGRAEQPR